MKVTFGPKVTLGPKRRNVGVAMRMGRAAAMILGACLATTACTAKTGSSPTAPTPTPTPTPAVRILTFARDTPTPIGEAVAVTFASRDQEQGKITLAVTGFNLTNRLSATFEGFSGVSGRIAWDAALLEADGLDSGDFMQQGGVTVSCCRMTGADAIPGSYPFFVVRDDGSRNTGSGELFLIRLKPVAGVTAGTTRVRFVEELQNKGGFPFTAFIVLSPFSPTRGSTVENVYGGTVTIQ